MILASRAEFTGLVADFMRGGTEQNRLLEGWRRSVIGDDLLELMREFTQAERRKAG